MTNRDFDANPVPEQIISNAEDATVYGVELTVEAEPVDRLRLKLDFGWLESEFTEFVDRRLVQFFTPGAPAVNQEISEDFSGNPLPNSAEFTVSLSAEYDLDLGRIGILTPGYYASWSDDVVFDRSDGRGLINNDGQTFIPEHGVGQKAYWIHNVRLQYKTQEGRIAAAGWVRNLTNEVYKVFAFENGDYVGNLVGAPRTYGVDLTLRW